ncbi:integral membrane protein [Streptomyces durhamensis]|uniref:integral membrane protein n=1 Tax=Streptomyces durhamensis TaxID=68194 RepID=UPI0004CD8C26|nr:integral membrane protein [Streptomyces durhamensis]
MQGLGYGQPVKPPHTAWLVLLRVLFVAIGFLSIGLLAWAMLLRLAIVTRRSLDWVLFAAALVADILSLVLVGTESGDEIHTPAGYFGLFLLLFTLVAGIAYYLAADIRHFVRRGQAYAAQRPAQAGYGYPGPAHPYRPATAPAMPIGRAGHDTPFPAAPPAPRHTPPPVPHTPVPQPPQRPAPSHIEQVRAELDELSDYLRRHDGRSDSHEGGR